MKDRTLTFADWDEAAQFVDASYAPPPSIVSEFVRMRLNPDALSIGQMASKAWLIHVLQELYVPQHATWAICGSWYSLIARDIMRNWFSKRIYGIDAEPENSDISEQLLRHWVERDWQYKAVIADCDLLDSSNMEFVTSGELINIKPEVILNTSCEHMSNHWFETCDRDQYIILQTNDTDTYEGHINTCANMEAVKKKYPLKRIFFEGEMQTPDYTRYMLVGKK